MNTVFQSYALFPHMTVEENVGFGLRWRAAIRGERARAVAAALALVGLERLERARPASCPAASSSAWRWRGRS